MTSMKIVKYLMLGGGMSASCFAENLPIAGTFWIGMTLWVCLKVYVRDYKGEAT